MSKTLEIVRNFFPNKQKKSLSLRCVVLVYKQCSVELFAKPRTLNYERTLEEAVKKSGA